VTRRQPTAVAALPAEVDHHTVITPLEPHMSSPLPPAPPIPADDPGDQRIQELLSRITDLSDDELNELRDLILQEFEEQANPAADVRMDEAALEGLEELAAAATAVKREDSRRDNNVTRGRDAQQVLAALRADGRSPGAQAVVPAAYRPRVSASSRSSARAITASGHPIGNRDDLAEEFIAAMRTQRMPTSRDGRVHVATIHADRPQSRILRRDDSPEAVTAALDAAAESHAQRAITAAGGLAAPEQVDYSLVGFEVVDRPVTSSLPVFTAQRGGVRFIRPPTLAQAQGAIGIWTVPMDLAAATNATIRKPSLRVTVDTEIVVDTQAVTNILTFGNMTARAYPELVARVTELALAAHSRLAEQQVLTQIGALSTSVTGLANEGGNLGATRVLLPLLDRAASGMRDRLRTTPDDQLQLILPHWARGILRSDLAIQEPGDARVGVTDSDLAAYFAARNLRPTWSLEGEAGQQFNVQAPGAVNAWPDHIISYLFPAGAMQFLDGGTLDLGLVRDSTLNAANDYQMFSESFEAVLFRGGESLRISQVVSPSGIARAAA